jgi:hypothetical protein
LTAKGAPPANPASRPDAAAFMIGNEGEAGLQPGDASGIS